MILAKEVVQDQMNNVDWGKYDLNDDGWVDRLLILHTSIGQEEGGNSNRIWSHFTTFDDVLDLPNDIKAGHYTMASLGTGDSGFGTIIHECYIKWVRMTFIQHMVVSINIHGKEWVIGT